MGKNRNIPGFFCSIPAIFALLFFAFILVFPTIASAVNVTLAWGANSEPDLAGYRVFLRQETLNYDHSNPAWEGTENTCTIFDLDENICYYFVVRAYNTSDLESGNSNEVVYQSSYNAPPTANAGPDQTVYEGDTVILNGSNSSDPDDDISFYQWTQMTGTQVALSGTEAVHPTFTAPDVEGPGGQFLTFQLTVTDETGLTSTDTCIVVVNNLDPYPGMRVTAGQLVLYSFEEGSGTRVYDVSGFGTPLDLLVEDEAAISWINGGGLEINSSTVIKSAGAARKVIDAVKASNELTIEAWITPANTTQSGPARIVTLSRDLYYRNFTLGQQSDTYDVRLRTTETSYNGLPSLSTPSGSLANQLAHVVYTRDVYGAIKLYMDGALVVSGTVGGDCSVWGDYALALANELTGDRPWLGSFHMVAIYDRALNQAEVSQNFAVGPGVAPEEGPDTDLDTDPDTEPDIDLDTDLDTDEDGITDQDEIDLYGTDPNKADTDGDGINDGEELAYWMDRWGADDDSDGLINLLDEDSDNDGFSDSLEISQGYDPSDPGSKPSSGSERVTAGQLVLYSFEEGSGTRVYDVSGFGTPLDLIVDDETAISWIAGGGLEIKSSTVIKSAGAARKVIDAVKASNELTIDGWITPANTTQSGPARIVTLSRDPYYRDFTLGQQSDTYDVRLRTTETSYNGIPSLSTPYGFLANQLAHVVYTRDVYGAIKLYMDGALVVSGTVGGDCSVWHDYALALANELTGDRPWLGTFHMVAIYDRALNQAEVSQNFAVGPGVAPEKDPDTDLDTDPDTEPDIDLDTDEDGITDQDEIDLYGTNPNKADSDGDGINDGEELAYWMDRWGADDDGDGLINLLDEDSDNDGLTDGLEIAQDYDPSDPSSKPGSGSERVTAGQLVLYSFEEGSGTRVHDVSGFGTPLDLIVDDETAISWIAGGGLEIKSSTVIKSAGAARKVIDAVKASNELTIDGWITPANTTQSGPARIVTLSRDPYYRDFTLGQQSDTYDVRLRTTETSYNGIPSLSTPYGSLANQLAHVVYTRDVYGAIKLYMDGALVMSGTVGGDCSVWGDYALALANELSSDRPWLGTYHMVAIFDRALDQTEVLQNFAAGPSLN
jgi:hypothetical protein